MMANEVAVTGSVRDMGMVDGLRTRGRHLTVPGNVEPNNGNHKIPICDDLIQEDGPPMKWEKSNANKSRCTSSFAIEDLKRWTD